MTSDNIKSHKKPPLSLEDAYLEKPQGGSN